MTEGELAEIVDRFLEAGVPPTAVAKALEMDPMPIRARMTELRIGRYGAAELSEALGNLQWEAFEQAKQMLLEAPYNVRSRFIMGILSKTMSLTARQNPETLNEMRVELLELMQQLGVGSDDVLGAIDTSQFVATAPPDEGEDEIPRD